MTFTDKVALYGMKQDLTHGWDSLEDDVKADVFADWITCKADDDIADELCDKFDTVIPFFAAQVKRDLDEALSDLQTERDL